MIGQLAPPPIRVRGEGLIRGRDSLGGGLQEVGEGVIGALIGLIGHCSAHYSNR